MRFRTKQMLAFSLLVALICSAFLVFSLGFYKNRIISEAEYRRSSLALHLHNMIINMVHAGDVLQLTATLRSICNDVTYIDYVFIIGADGHLLAHTFDTGFPSELFNANLLPADKLSTSKLLMTSKGYVRDFAIRTVKHMPGEIHVGMNEEVFYKQINDLVKISLIMTIVCLALGLFLVYIISGYLSKPLKNLYLGMKKIENGDLEYRLEEKGDYEVLNILQGYNRMTESILDSTTRLQQAKENIEKLNSLLYAIRNINQLIIREKDRKRLLQGACDSLIDARALYSAWITLLDESGASVTFAQAGFDEDFLLIKKMLHQGELPACGQIALRQPDVVVTENPASTCTNCPLKERYGDRVGIAVRLEHGGNVYGLLAATVPKHLTLEKQELSLFKEIAGDIAFALHTIELEEKHKQADATLLKERNFSQSIIDTARAIILVLNPDGTIAEFNPYMEELSGYSIEEVRGKDWFETFHPERDRPKTVELFNKAISDINTKGNINPIVSRDGKEVTIEWFDRTLKDKNGNITGLLAIGQNITERKSIEEQLRQSRKMEAVGTLAGGVAHDFNNLLTVIIGNAELALMDVIKDESLRKEIEEIKKAGGKAASLTRQLLAFSRKQVIKPEVIDLNEGINETKNMLKRTIGEDIEFLTVLKPELWKVHTDSGQIDQIIMNMVVNARDAMPQGGKLTIETANADIDRNYFREHGIKGEKPGHYVMLAVSDTGKGMDKETREHIFEPFFTTKEVGKGTGLGLSTVYGIVKQSNGFVWVYSEPGLGSTFKVYLPKVKGDAKPEEKEQSPVDDPGGSETVLIVEDDYGLRKFAQEVLQSYGYRILVAENGENALRVSKEYESPIHLLLTDVVMPKMSGKEVAERLQPLNPRMKVIYMSGYTDNAIVRHGVLEPGINFLEKPFTPEGLARKVRKAIESEWKDLGITL
ncbi:MAG: hypothetical protein BBJ57_13040 [Desulfobacterales bacterium PC51MH44]|nr:MAG: hypothetical protein BBJ57_13040 [Desulfobacterales bacterium PC51MH44]